ncbi:hypothetical protein FRB98_007993, partial [Tulasnella sp. 332]
LANHGYLPRDGIVNLTQIIDGSSKGFNMAADLATLLGTVSLIYDGDVTTGKWSIGGSDSRTSFLGRRSSLPNLIGKEGGLDYHTAGIEGDASITRLDAYFGNDHTTQPELYQQLKGFAANYGGLYTMDALQDHALARWKNSIATNPTFYFVPVAATLGTGAKGFPAIFFSNGTYGAGGVPNEESISSFFGAKKQLDGSYRAVPERFPTNWYKRADPFTLLETVTMILDIQLKTGMTYGANTGKVDSFVPLNITAISDVNGMVCLVLDAIQANVPGTLAGVVGDVDGILANVVNSFAPLVKQFGCPAYNTSLATAILAASHYVVPSDG